VVPIIDDEYVIDEGSKFRCFCVDKTKLDNVNRNNYRANKHVEVWAKNVFVE